MPFLFPNTYVLTILVGLVGGLGVDSCLVALILNLDGGTDS